MDKVDLEAQIVARLLTITGLVELILPSLQKEDNYLIPLLEKEVEWLNNLPFTGSTASIKAHNAIIEEWRNK